MSTLINDLRVAVRSLLKARSFTALVLVILTVGIGATTAIFSAVNEVMFRPLQVGDPDRLVMLWESNEQRGWQQVQVAPANALDWRAQVRSFADVAMVGEFTNSVALSGGTESVQIATSPVSGNAFSVFGAIPVLGRTFIEAETWADADPVALLTHAAWVRYFNADSSVVNRVVRLDGVPTRVVGVLSPAFKYPITDAELFTTFRFTGAQRDGVWFRQAHVVRAVARLRPGVTADAASRELAAVSARLERELPATNRGMTAGLTPLHDFLTGTRRFPLLLLLSAVGVLQLIVCANVATLLLARALTRRQEMAVRVALGASRGRIARQVLTEGACLAAVGAVLGLALGVYGLDAIMALRPDSLPEFTFRLDWRMLAFTSGVATASAFLFGIQPALSSSRVDVSRQLGESPRTGTMGRRGLRAAHMLTAVEVALAVMLVAGAGLILRSIGQLRQIDSGVKMDNVLTFEINPPSGAYRTDDAKADFAQRLIERLETVPGVRSVGAGRSLPFAGIGWSSDFTIEGWGSDKFGVEVRHREATAGYFRALSIPLRDGALPPDRVAPNAPMPVLVNDAFVAKYFPGQSPVGRRITFNRVPDSTSYWYSIVGVVGNERMELTSEPQPEIIAHLAADTPRLMRFVVKADQDPTTLVPQLRSALAELDPEIPLMRVRSMETVAVDALAADRYLMILLGVFAAVALVLAAVGVYGVAAQAARARTREIGIRLALGATPRDVARTLSTRGLSYVLLGVAGGVIGTRLAANVTRKLLFRVEPTDPITMVSVAVLLVLVALGATLVPARRASRVDPTRVLSGE
jgi:putative ABC transport system permease protein